MTATRTALGTASLKASGDTLTISDVLVRNGHSLEVGIGYDPVNGHPTSVKHDGRDLKRKPNQTHATAGIAGSMWLKGGYRHRQQGDIVATWSGNITKRAMWASSYDREQNQDSAFSREDAADTTPTTGHSRVTTAAGAFVVGVDYHIELIGTTDFTLIGAASNTLGLRFTATGVGTGTGRGRQAISVVDTMAICCFVAEGPLSDLPGTVTARIEDDDVWETVSLLQSAGTNGGGALNNIYVIETALNLLADRAPRGQLQSATNRDWVSMISVLEPREAMGRAGLSISDFLEVEQITVGAGGNPDDLYYGFNEDTGLWEAYETATPGTLRAVSKFEGGGDWDAP